MMPTGGGIWMAGLTITSVEQFFSLNTEQLMTMSVLQAFVLAAGILVALILLGGLATLAGRWVSHSVDRIFEWLLLLTLGAAIAYLMLGGYLRLH